MGMSNEKRSKRFQLLRDAVSLFGLLIQQVRGLMCRG
jgi:hypothetical protein